MITQSKTSPFSKPLNFLLGGIAVALGWITTTKQQALDTAEQEIERLRGDLQVAIAEGKLRAWDYAQGALEARQREAANSEAAAPSAVDADEQAPEWPLQVPEDDQASQL